MYSIQSRDIIQRNMMSACTIMSANTIKVSFHLNTMTAHYTCTLFKLLYRRYKLTVIACRGLKRSLWPGWVRSRPFTCSSLFKAISPTLDFCNSKLGSCAFYVDFITVAILCFLTSEFSSVSCKEETVFP